MVSFIILNYNTPPLTKQCADSICQFYVGGEYEVIVVDNNSTPENKSVLESLMGSNRIVWSKINTGFGLGNMLGAQVACGDYLCFLNSDVVLVEDSITPLVEYLASHQDVGVITPRQERPNGAMTFSFRHRFGIRRDLLGDDIFEYLFPKKYPRRSDLSRTEPFAVSEINGSFMMFRSEVFWEIGGFDTNIFLFHEEYDIGRRLERAGYKNVVFPSVHFLHAHGASSSENKKDIRKERFISKIYCYSKYHNPMMSLLFRLENILLKSFSPRNWFLIPVFLRGNVLSLSMRPSVKKRRG